MIYNKDSYSVECDAAELCLLGERNGDVGSYAPIYSGVDIADGSVYYKLQSEAGGYYKTDTELSLTSDIGGIYFTVTARLDGVIRREMGVTVDKIKATRGKGYPLPDALTLALLKIHCYLLCVKESLSSICGRVSSYNIETKKIKYFNYKYTFSELKDFYLSMIERIKYRIKAVFEQAKARDLLVEARFPYGELREGQEIMIRESFSAIKKGRRVFIEAPTGTGKTISALYPAARAMGEGYCDKIFYLTPKTATRKEAFSAMAKLYSSGSRLRTVVISAKEQVCPCGKSGDGKRVRCSDGSCEYSRGYYSRLDSALREMLENYTGYSTSLIRATAEKYKVCPYELSLDLSELCDVVICDYNYVFDPVVYFRRYFGANAPKGRYTFLIDEAHNLGDRVREAYSAELLLSSLSGLREKIDALDKSEISQLLVSAEEAFFALVKLCKDNSVRDENGDLRGFYIGNEPIESLVKALERFSAGVGSFLFKNPAHYLFEEVLELSLSVKRFLKICELFDSNFRFYVSLFGGDISVKCYCLDPSELINASLLRAESAVLFSATLTPAEYFCNILGGKSRARTVSLPSPFDSENLCVAVADYVNTRFEDREDNAKRFATVIAATVKARAGNYIAYFPSYKCLEDTYKAFVKKYPLVTTVVQRKNMTVRQKDEFLSEFKEDSGRLRIGFCVLGGVFSEGVDLPGSRLIGSIIFGVGLPALSNEKNILREYYDNKNEEGIGYDYAYTFPGMNNVLQAAGRVIRGSDDVGVVVLADDRYATPKYRELFPAHWKGVRYAGNASSLAEIMRRFWENR